MAQQLVFNKDVFIPDFARVPLFEGTVCYKKHALRRADEDGSYDDIHLPPLFVAKNATLVEVEIDPVTGKVTKQVWRQPLDAKRDLCFPMFADGFIPTVWVNDKTDTHKTLNKAKFVGGFQWRQLKSKMAKST